MPTIYNKVVLDGTTLMDISDTTATASDVAQGKYFYTTAGVKTEGTASGSSGTPVISVVDTTDSHGGTVRTITAVDISDTTAIASDVASGKYFYTANGTKTLGTASGSGNVGWETLWDGDVNFTYDNTENYPYCEISALGSTSILADSVWRVTYANTEYICTAKTNGNFITIGNPKWGGGTDDGSDVPFVFYKTQAGAWGGEVNAPNEQSTYHFKIERQTTSPSSQTLITKTITANGTYSAQSDNADGYSEVTVNVSGGGSSGTGQTVIGTVTGDGTNILEIPCNFAPDLIYVYGDMSGDVANRGVVSLTIIKDVAIYASYDSSTSSADNYANALHDITGYNESDTSFIHATYSNNTLTIDTVQNSTSTRWRSGQVYNYKLSTIGTGGGSSSPTLVTKEITSNGTYTASNDSADGYSSVTVNVPSSGITPTGSINITTNGTHDVTNYASAVVSVSSGGTPSQTQHTIYFEFEDNTNTTIVGYWDDSFITNTILATTPRTYNNKTTTLAQFDGTTWYSYNPSAIPLNTQLIDFSLCTADSAIDGETGAIIEREWYYVSDYTRVDPSMTFSYKAGIWTYIGLYDSNKAFVDTIYVYSDGTVDPNDGNLATGTLTPSKMPSNVAYVRLSSVGTSSDEMSLIRTA